MNIVPAGSNITEALLQELSQDITKINLLGNELETLNQNITATGDTTVKSELLNRKEKDVSNLIRSASHKFTLLSTHSITEQVTKIHAERLKSDFQRCIQRVQRVEFDIKRRMLSKKRHTEPHVADIFGLGDGGDTLPCSSQIQLQPDQADVQELASALQQEDQMRVVENDIVNINEIFQQLSTLIYEQREMVDSIENNVEATYMNTEAGTRQLEKASNTRQRSRKRCCICSILLIVILAFVILVLILVYGYRGKQ